ncbi:MAG: SpoIIE family protein phosphatase [Bacteroidota bacterium]|nr:SpoIIE family protein phosphatase [Bacteroidota bacterium]
MSSSFYIEVHCQRRNFEGQRICGDVFLSKRIPEENRVIAVLSDGMGHGVKANVLATLTSTLALNFTKEHKDANTIAETVMKALPDCSVRKMSYATFTIIDIEFDGTTQIIEYGNPQTAVFRGAKPFDPEWQCVLLTGENAGKEIKTCSFKLQKEDRIVFFSDGITQSGTGSIKYPNGWGLENVTSYSAKLIANNPSISAKNMASKLVNIAYQNDGFKSKDDTSCAAIYLREPRRLLLCSGPPVESDSDAEMTDILLNFKGRKVICGATTSEIISNHSGIAIIDGQEFDDPELPPISFMKGIDLVTEGILTLSKVALLLRNYQNSPPAGKGPADQVVKLLLESDEIHLLIGMRINQAHHVPGLPLELEVRPTVARRIAGLLEDEFMKEVFVRFM